MYYPTVCTESVMKAAQASVEAYFSRCAARGIEPQGTRDEKLSYEMAQAHNAEQMAAHRANIAKDKVARIRAAKNDLANKDRWTRTDYAKSDQLSRDLRVALADLAGDLESSE